MGVISKLGAFALCIAASAGAALAETPVLKLSALEGGTVNWELDTIKHYGLDTANGFDLQVTAAAGTPASQIAFQAGEADSIVSDWLWVARQRAEGQDYVFLPYSKTVGALLVPKDSTAAKLSDLAGAKVGIAGGPVDKSWLILRAYARKVENFDLAGQTEQVFGAPPLIFKSALDGELAGAVNFWHFNAKMEAAGMRPLVSVTDAAVALGLDPETPLLGYVVKGDMVRDHPDLIAGLAKASRQAKDLLATDEAAWDRLREMMNVTSDEQFAALKAGYRAGIPGTAPVDEAAAGRMLALMAELGGKELVGDVTELPEGVFLQPGS